MSVFHPAPWQRHALLLCSVALMPLTAATAVFGQQSASPDLLPPVIVVPSSAARPAVVPLPRRTPQSRRAVRSRAPKPVPVVTQVESSGPSAANLYPTTVVSPTGLVTPTNQIASSITVITARDLERDQRRTVPEALATVPGLNIVQNGGPGGQTSVFMRGTNSNHTKVLIDGIDVSDPSNVNRSFDFGQLLTADIQQIEVLRGPQSGLYGADALGGVISIITKKGEGPPRATAMVEGGSHGTFNQAVGLSGAQDRIDYAFNVAHFRSSDTPVTPVELLPPGRQAIGNAYDNLTYSGKVGADVTENFRVNAVARYTDATLKFTGNSGFPSFPSAAQSTQVINQFFSRTEGIWSLFDGRFKNYFGVNYTNSWNSNIAPTDIRPTITQGERVKFDYRGVASVTPWETVVIGADHETETLQTATLAAQNVNRGAYIESQTAVANRIFLTGNFRADSNDRFGDYTTYRIAPAVILPVTDTKLKASYGTGFKAPTLNQQFVSFPSFNFFANPNLLPETSTGYDVGFEQPLFNDRVRFGSTYFHNDITNLITTNTTFTSYANIGRATTEGTENFVAATITDKVRLRGDYTYTRAIDAGTGLELLRRPRNKWSATAIFNPVDRSTFSVTLLHVGSFVDGNRSFSIPRLTAPAYTVVNLAADYALNDQLKLFARVDNLFDRRYQNPTGYLQPGLGIFGGVRVASFDVR